MYIKKKSEVEVSDPMKIKSEIKNAAERVYDVFHDQKYDVKMAVFDKEKNNAVSLKTKRDTQHTKKWHSKNR